MKNQNANESKAVCYIIGAMKMGEETFFPKDGDFVIAADGGYTNLKKLGMKPDFVIGDFDSLPEIPENENIIRLPKEKNDTDTLYAVKLGLEKGYREFTIFGGIGGRLDHTLANIQTLAFIAEQGGRGFLVGEGNIITAIKNDRILFSAEKKGIISVFCNSSKAVGVTETGLKYSLTNATLTSDMPLGVSNEFVGKESVISVEDGVLIIVWSL